MDEALQPLRIAHVISDLSPRCGGPAAAAISLGRHEQALQHQVTWWATRPRSDSGLPDVASTDIHQFRTQFPRSWYCSPSLARALRAALHSIDLLHLHQVWDYPLYAAGHMARRFGVPYLVTPHGIFTQRWRSATLKKALYLHLFARYLLNGAACIHVVTPAEIPGLRAAGISVPITAIPNGVEPQRYASLPPSDEAEARWPELTGKHVVLYLGRLSPEKGLAPLLKGWQMVQREHPQAVLLLAGEGKPGYVSWLEKLVVSLDIHRAILMPGWLTGEAKLSLLSRADIFILPSISEGFSLALLEALACGKPCILTPGCNFPQLTEIGAGQVVAPTAPDLAQGLSDMLSLTASDRQAMGQQGRALVLSDYTWERAARKLLTVYGCIIRGETIPLNPEPLALPSTAD